MKRTNIRKNIYITASKIRKITFEIVNCFQDNVYGIHFIRLVWMNHWDVYNLQDQHSLKPIIVKIILRLNISQKIKYKDML